MKMTEQPKTPNFYPINFEKLKGESVGTILYFLGILSFSEDYEHFDKIKHLLIIPEPPKSLEEIQQELDERIDKRIERVKEKFNQLGDTQEYRYNQKFNRIIDNFEYARKNGFFPLKSKIVIGAPDGSYLVSNGSNPSFVSHTYVIKQGNNHEGYYTFGTGFVRFYMTTKPNAITRWFMKNCLSFIWVDEK
jgi:hypothetical protein